MAPQLFPPILILFAITQSGARADADSGGVRNCREYGERAWLSPQTQRCVVPLSGNCSRSWLPEAYQCGLSVDGGFCDADDVCRCRKQFYDDDRANSPYGRVGACAPKLGLNGPCSEHVQCGNYTECDWRSGTCKCSGEWNESVVMCYNSQYCQGEHFLRGVYDSETRRCICLLGRVCGNGGSEPLLSPENCPPNSSPNAARNACVCHEGLAPTTFGRSCLPAIQYGEMCERKGEGFQYNSSAIESLGQCVNSSRCMDGVCRCLPDVQIWNAARGRCLLVSGGQYCGSGEYSDNKEECTPNTKCEGGTCVCPVSAGYKVTESGECFGGLGARCTSSSSANCSPGLSCVNGKCGCRDLLRQFYDPSKEACVSLVGGRCGAGFGSCVDSAVCDSSTGVCICPIDLVPTPNRARCFKALMHGENCTATADVNDCDFRKGLTCSTETDRTEAEATCVCADSSLDYDASLGACVSTIGQGCGHFEIDGSCLAPMKTGQGNSVPLCEYYYVSCQPGSSCQEKLTAGLGPEREKLFCVADN